MRPFALSRYYQQADYAELAPELPAVDEFFTKDAPQSEHRRWEYALALRALHSAPDANGSLVDVGGAGSPFWRMAYLRGYDNCYVVDPHENHTLAQYLAGCPRLAAAVTCLSVLEHVEDLDQFLYHLTCLVKPGGLLVLTMDACGCRTHGPTEDPHHFAGMRKRIVTPPLRDSIYDTLAACGCRPLGPVDYDTCTPQLYGGATDPGYTFASLVLTKRA